MDINIFSKFPRTSNRLCVICFLLGLVMLLSVMLLPQQMFKQALPPQILRMSVYDEQEIQVADPLQPRNNGVVEVSDIPSDKGDKPYIKANPPQAPPSKLNVYELTAELTRRLAHNTTNRVIVYDQPCQPTGVGACVDSNCQHPLNYSPRDTVERLTQSPEMTLSADQQQAISTLGNDIPDSDLIITSAVSSNHFDEMQAMFESLHKTVYPLLEQRMEATKRDPHLLQQQNKVGIESFTVALFDIGLTQAERIRIEKNCRCKLVTFRKDLFPDFVKANNCYSWKPPIVLAASQHARKLIVWQDSSVRWFPSFLDNLDRAYSSGHQVLRYLNSHRIPANTLKETFDYLHEEACGYLPYPEIQGNLHIHRSDQFNQQVVFTPWARCALEKQCMCPRQPASVLSCSKGTLHRCHRFDQSAMGLLLSRIYQQDLYKFMFQEFEFNKEKGFRVSRGSVNRNYFKS